MLALVLFTAFLVIRTAPDSFVGKALRRGLVDWPAERLSRLTRGQLVCWLGFGLALWAALAVLGGDAVRMMSMAMPETVAWLAMFDMSVLADALVRAALIATQTRLSGARQRLRALLSRFRRRSAPRARAPRRRREAAKTPANDDKPAPAWKLTGLTGFRGRTGSGRQFPQTRAGGKTGFLVDSLYSFGEERPCVPRSAWQRLAA